MQLLKSLEDMFSGAEIEIAGIAFHYRIENIVKDAPPSERDVGIFETVNLVMVRLVARRDLD